MRGRYRAGRTPVVVMKVDGLARIGVSQRSLDCGNMFNDFHIPMVQWKCFRTKREVDCFPHAISAD